MNSEIVIEHGGLCTLSEIRFDELPTAKRIFGSHTDQVKIDNIISRITSENREGKINSILNNDLFEEIKLEDDEEYKSATEIKVVPLPPPSNIIYYCEFKY